MVKFLRSDAALGIVVLGTIAFLGFAVVQIANPGTATERAARSYVRQCARSTPKSIDQCAAEAARLYQVDVDVAPR